MPANWAQATRYFHSSLAVLCNVPFLQYANMGWVVEFSTEGYKIKGTHVLHKLTHWRVVKKCYMI